MGDMNKKIRMLFVCTGNSCRSQMAEGWTRYLKGDCIDAYSAGIRPIGVSSRAIKVMAEAGVDISSHSSKQVDEFVGIDFDYVITVCDNARERCPIFGGRVKHIHKSFEDPYFAAGSEEHVMTLFREVRDDIRAFVETLPGSLKKPVKETDESRE